MPDGEGVGILVRNPEPFNDPKMPLEDVAGTLGILKGSALDQDYEVLYSKDYAQALLWPKPGVALPSTPVAFQFQYKRWNGSTWEIQSTENSDLISL
ncbi:MAG: hypothetical protein AAFQ98_22170 [Bacteroidota bacterium]